MVWRDLGLKPGLPDHWRTLDPLDQWADIKWNHLFVWKRMSSGPFKNVIYKTCLEIIYLIYIYKKDLALNNLQWLICHKTKPKQKSVLTVLNVRDEKKGTQFTSWCLRWSEVMVTLFLCLNLFIFPHGLKLNMQT